MTKTKGKLILGFLLTVLVIAGWMGGRAQAMDTRPTIPVTSSPEGDANPNSSGSSKIVYELAPEFQIQQAKMRGEEGARRLNVIGIVSWGCIGAGVLVVVIVLITGSRRRPGTPGVKRTRYRREVEAERARRYMDDNRYRKY